MRISLSGAAGIGKTTLAKALAETFGLPLLDEDFREIVHAFNRAATSGDRQELVAGKQAACLAWLDKREALYARPSGFVEDRCAIDILFRWLITNLSDDNNQATLQMVERVRRLLEQTDYLVIPPFSPFSQDVNEGGLLRAGSLSRLYKAQSMVLGLAQLLVEPAKLIVIDPECRSLEARVAYLSSRIPKSQ